MDLFSVDVAIQPEGLPSQSGFTDQDRTDNAVDPEYCRNRSVNWTREFIQTEGFIISYGVKANWLTIKNIFGKNQADMGIKMQIFNKEPEIHLLK